MYWFTKFSSGEYSTSINFVGDGLLPLLLAAEGDAAAADDDDDGRCSGGLPRVFGVIVVKATIFLRSSWLEQLISQLNTVITS